MAKQYMVVNGLQLETITVGVGVYDPHNSSPLDSVTLDSVTIALGTGIVADLDALKLLWDPSATGVTDIYQKQARGFLKSSSNLFPGTTTDVDGGNASQLHQTSYVYILPRGTADTLTALSTDNTSATNEYNRIIVCLLYTSPSPRD